MMSKYPEVKEREEMRKIIGRYGLSGQQQVIGRTRRKRDVESDSHFNNI